MKEESNLLKVLKSSMQRHLSWETRIFLEFEGKASHELSWLLYKNPSEHYLIFSIFDKELADEKYHTK